MQFHSLADVIEIRDPLRADRSQLPDLVRGQPVHIYHACATHTKLHEDACMVFVRIRRVVACDRIDALCLRIIEVGDGVNVMYAEIHDDPDIPDTRIVGTNPSCTHGYDTPEHSRIDDLLQSGDRRVVALDVPDHQPHTRSLCSR